MKKLSYLLSLYAIAVLALLSSCGKDDEPVPGPTIGFLGGTGFTSSDASVAPGSMLMVGVVTTKGDKELKSYTVALDGNTITSESIADLPNNMENGFQDTIMITVPAARATAYVYTFSVTSKDDQVATATLRITSQGAAELASYPAVSLGNKLSSTGSFYNVATNTVLTQAQAEAAQGSVDFVHYFGANNLATIASPADADAATIYPTLATFNPRNATMFSMTNLTATQFADIATETELTTAVGTPNLSAVPKLTQGQVFAFKTASGKIGLALVNAISGSSSTAGTISLNVKAQK